MSIQQLLLPIRPHDEATFVNFFPGQNQVVINYLRTFTVNNTEHCVYLWGKNGVGCSHLLQACCHALHEKNISSFYLPLRQIKHLTPAIFENLETVSLVCVDDVQVIAGNAELEEALFHLYNRIIGNKKYLLLAANVAPVNLNIQLLDLKSRLQNGMIFQIQELTDPEKLMALQLRATFRGLELSDEVGRFLLTHWPRDFSFLFSALEKLDHASLAEQRRLTIPFVKQVLG